MAVTVEQVGAALSGVVDPNTGKDLVAGKSAKNIRVDDGHVSVDIELGYPARSQIDPIRRAANRFIPTEGNVVNGYVDIQHPTPADLRLNIHPE